MQLTIPLKLAGEWGVGNFQGLRSFNPYFVTPDLIRGLAFLQSEQMDREQRGGWVYIMADRYRGTIYVGVTADLAKRIHQHRRGNGSEFCTRYGLTKLVWVESGDSIESCIAHEKLIKRWRREWKFDLIEKANPEWDDLFDQLL